MDSENIAAIARGQLVEAMKAQMEADADEGYSFDRAARSALSAIKAQGLVVVPVTPTPEMIEATRKMEMPRADSAQAMVSAMIVGTWNAMLAAAGDAP